MQNKLKVLIIGSGAREHAFAWKIRQSPMCGELFCAPGNPGTAEIGTNVAIDSHDIPGLLEFVKKSGIDFTIVGPEVPLSMGIVDRFQEHGLKIFGPSQEAARLESSKAFAKEIMQAAKVHTAKFTVLRGGRRSESWQIGKDPRRLCSRLMDCAQARGFMFVRRRMS